MRRAVVLNYRLIRHTENIQQIIITPFNSLVWGLPRLATIKLPYYLAWSQMMLQVESQPGKVKEGLYFA